MGIKVAMLASGLVLAMAGTARAGSGDKRTGEVCVEDNECSRGHCHTKENGQKVCVDCSSSDINDYRGQIQRFCKDEPRSCTEAPRTVEVPEVFFSLRIDNGDRCVRARSDENSRCWNGGDDKHKQALDEAERSRKNCYDDLNTRRGNGGIYTCSDSTYSSRASDVESACSGYGSGCDAWSKDDKVVSCNDIEDAMKKADRCVVTMEQLDSDCLPRTSGRRDAQFRDGKKAYDGCKEILDYKRDKKLCR